MEIKIMDQNSEKIVSVNQITEKREDSTFVIKGTLKNNSEIILAKYELPYYSNIVMRHVFNLYNENSEQIINLPEDDKDIEKLFEETELEERTPDQNEFYGDDAKGKYTKKQLENIVKGGSN